MTTVEEYILFWACVRVTNLCGADILFTLDVLRNVKCLWLKGWIYAVNIHSIVPNGVYSQWDPSPQLTQIASLDRTHHDDVIKWKNFPPYWPFVREIYRSQEIPRKRTGDAERFYLTFAWANNRDVGDLRRHRAHYDVTVMITHSTCSFSNQEDQHQIPWSVFFMCDDWRLLWFQQMIVYNCAENIYLLSIWLIIIFWNGMWHRKFNLVYTWIFAKVRKICWKGVLINGVKWAQKGPSSHYSTWQVMCKKVSASWSGLLQQCWFRH